MAEARVAPLHPQHLGGGGQRAARQHRGIQHLARRPAGPPVERTAHRPEAGADHGVRVGPHRRRDPRREGGRGQLVVDHQHQRRVQHRHELRPGPHRRQARPQPPGHGAAAGHAVAQHQPRRAAVAHQRQALDHAGDHRPPAGGDGLGPEVVPRGIGHRRQVDREPEPVAQAAARGHRQRHSGPGPAPRSGRTPVQSSSATCSNVADVASSTASWPRKRSAWPSISVRWVSISTSNVEPAAHPPRSTTEGDGLHVGGVEQARPAVGGAGAAEHAPADVGVHRLHLHAEPLRRLGRRQGAHGLIIINVDNATTPIARSRTMRIETLDEHARRQRTGGRTAPGRGAAHARPAGGLGRGRATAPAPSAS